MSDLSWIYEYGFLGARLFDLPSFLICLLLILILGYKYQVPYNYQIVLGLHCLVPFFLNGVLFDPSYMSDQFKYWQDVNDIRSGHLTYLQAINDPGDVPQASAFLSLLPLPSPVSVASLGFYNTFLYIMLFFILYTKNIFTKTSLWFYLIFPSAALYSALSLRETLIFLFMTLAVVYARSSKLLISIVFLLMLYMIKFQNFLIMAPIILLYFSFGVASKGMGISKAIITIAVVFAILMISAPIAIPEINRFRMAMYVEDGGLRDEIILIDGVTDFITQGLTSGIYFLSKPFVWEAQGLLPLLQSVENTIILAFLYLITKQAWKNTPDRLAFWLLYLAISMSIYGLVVFNYGTAVRYRYPFVMIYVLFVCADCNIQKLLPKRNKINP